VRSIRANLVLWLVSALAMGTIVVLAATYELTRNQLGRVFDDELKQVALAVQMREDWTQTRRVRIARPGFALAVRAYDEAGRIYFETALPSLPGELPQTYAEGFAYMGSAEEPWRVYTHVTEEGTVQVGQAVGARDALARDLSISVLMPMLMLIPLLAVLVAWVLKRGLAPLDETSHRVSDRDASRLDPLPTDSVPRELLPLVEQINALLARLEGALGAQRRFLADAAHELRSPVAALALQVQLAERAHSPAARATALAELERGVERARRLVQQLMDFARLEPGVQSAPFQPVNVARIAREVVGSYAPRAEAEEVDLGADAPVAAWISGAEAELPRFSRTWSTTRCVTRPATAPSPFRCARGTRTSSLPSWMPAAAFRRPSATACSSASTASPAMRPAAPGSASPSSRRSSSATRASLRSPIHSLGRCFPDSPYGSAFPPGSRRARGRKRSRTPPSPLRSRRPKLKSALSLRALP
jgi:two-component system OmpR family sensor kinase